MPADRRHCNGFDSCQSRSLDHVGDLVISEARELTPLRDVFAQKQVAMPFVLPQKSSESRFLSGRRASAASDEGWMAKPLYWLLPSCLARVNSVAVRSGAEPHDDLLH